MRGKSVSQQTPARQLIPVCAKLWRPSINDQYTHVHTLEQSSFSWTVCTLRRYSSSWSESRDANPASGFSGGTSPSLLEWPHDNELPTEMNRVYHHFSARNINKWTYFWASNWGHWMFPPSPGGLYWPAIVVHLLPQCSGEHEGGERGSIGHPHRWRCNQMQWQVWETLSAW